VTLSWNTSSILTTGRGYILRVKSSKNDHLVANDLVVKQYEDIDVGIKMNSYTVNGLLPGHTFIFELCLRKAEYIIPISSVQLTTKGSEFEDGLGIETDYVSLVCVAAILSIAALTCLITSVIRVIRFHEALLVRKQGDSLSQREMIISPSDHSSVVSNNLHVTVSSNNCNRSILSSGDQSRLVDNEVASPVDETFA
jgi:hypothetical protein